MKYEVKKNGRTYMGADHDACRYPPEVESGIQAAGYDIYIDSKRQPKRRPQTARGGARK